MIERSHEAPLLFYDAPRTIRSTKPIDGSVLNFSATQAVVAAARLSPSQTAAQSVAELEMSASAHFEVTPGARPLDASSHLPAVSSAKVSRSRCTRTVRTVVPKLLEPRPCRIDSLRRAVGPVQWVQAHPSAVRSASGSRFVPARASLF